MVDLLPFNEHLNRLILKVRNAGKGQLRVTWGNASKDFSSDQLLVGINLPAEFPDGPLNGAFAAIQKAVAEQQAFETPMVKTLLHSIPAEKQLLPDAGSTFDQLVNQALQRDQALFSAAAALANQPQQHTIKIEPVP
jgi:hypothetical protein